MEIEQQLLLAFLPWAIFVVLALFAKRLISLANKRKGIAMAFGVLVQLFLPDPQVQKTIDIMVVQKRSVDGAERSSDDDVEDDKHTLS